MFIQGFEKVAAAKWKGYLAGLLSSGNKRKIRDFAYKMLKDEGPLAGYDPNNLKAHLFLNKAAPPNADLKAAFTRAVKEVNKPYKSALNTRLKFKKRRPAPPPPFKLLHEHESNIKLKEYSPDDWVDISHGGTKQHILDFLRKKTKGYSLERGGLGIQVSPNFRDRDISYAIRAGGGRHGGTPAILTGKIQAKYLYAANNFYEAGLPQENIKHIKGLRIKVLPRTKNMEGGGRYVTPEEYASTFEPFKRGKK